MNYPLRLGFTADLPASSTHVVRLRNNPNGNRLSLATACLIACATDGSGSTAHGRIEPISAATVLMTTPVGFLLNCRTKNVSDLWLISYPTLSLFCHLKCEFPSLFLLCRRLDSNQHPRFFRPVPWPTWLLRLLQLLIINSQSLILLLAISH